MPHATPVATRSAQMLATDALEMVTKEHTGSISHFLVNTASTTVSTMTTEQRVAVGASVAMSVGVGVAAIATGGLAIPVLLALGGAGYLLSNAITKIGEDIRRKNRNWLARFPNAQSSTDGALLTIEASDAMRRAIDHYRMMRTISQEVEAHTGVDYATCEDAINHAKAVARFIHHSDKVRNYTLPMLDLLIFYMKQYLEVKKAWDAWEPAFQRSLQSWFEGHGTESCCAGKPEPCVCYAPFSGLILGGARAGSKPAKRIAGASGTIPAVFPEAGPAPGHPDAVDIEAIIDGMTSARAKIVNEMHRSETARGNYSAVRPELTAASAGGARETPQEAVGNQRRIKLLIDTVWKQVDRPGYFSRGTRRMAHWYTRHTTSEKVGTIFSEATAMGSIFTPFTQALHVSDLAKSAVSGSIGLATTLTDKLGFGALKSADGKPLKSSLVSAAVIDEKITAEIRAHGANVQSLMPKLMLHFGRAAKALELLQASPTRILSCSDAMSVATKSMELMAQMEKVSRYAGPCLGIIDILSKACFTWSENEHRIWHEMESHLGVFLRDPLPHQVCRDTGKKCYGARHHKVGTGILGTGGKWAVLNQEPHNPV